MVAPVDLSPQVAELRRRLQASGGEPPDNVDVDITREELSARLETIESKMDARIATIEGKFELLFYRMDEMGKGVSNLRWWILGAALSIVVAAAATAVGIQQMTVSTFQAAAQQAATTAQQQPIIINVPAPAATPAK